MDRFLENSDPEQKQRSNEIQAKLNWCRERIRQLTEAKVTVNLYLTGTPTDCHLTAPAVRRCVDRDLRLPIEEHGKLRTRGGSRALCIIEIRSNVCEEGARGGEKACCRAESTAGGYLEERGPGAVRANLGVHPSGRLAILGPLFLLLEELARSSERVVQVQRFRCFSGFERRSFSGYHRFHCQPVLGMLS